MLAWRLVLLGALLAATGCGAPLSLALDAQDQGGSSGQADGENRPDGGREQDSRLEPEGAAEAVEAENREGCAAGSGCFGELCREAGDCLSGLCLSHMGDQVCSQYCVEECPSGFVCKQLGGTGSDLLFACVSPFGHLCRPCHASGDCNGPGSEDAACIRYEGAGWFCGAPCEIDGDCPAGFTCDSSLSSSGALIKQCAATSSQCTCSPTSIALGLTTPCEQANEWGQCSGLRTCQPGGLTQCTAPLPQQEVCNGSDDDCDGVADEEGCDDGNPCTVDYCQGASGCQHQSLEGNNCDDGDPCTLTDHCDLGECVGTPIKCNDANPCTDDSCDASGCKFTPNQLPCDDGDPCTIADLCQSGECAGTHVGSCDDGNPCTKDSCDPVGGCLHLTTTGPCNDGNLCTVGDSCFQGKCQPGSAIDCNDGDVCSDDSCDPKSGCLHQHNLAPCNDGNLCTLNDQCLEGECIGGKSLSCEDGNPCTDNPCLPLVGCSTKLNNAECDDSDPCTQGDSCTNGFCVGLSPADCNDGNPCTDDFCLPMVGCSQSSNSAPCDDGNLCTVADKCLAGKCQPGPTMTCTDGNPCTDDSCSPASGCLFKPNLAPCDDKNQCTTGDHCTGGICIGQGTLQCDDSNPCTLDLCLPAGGCDHQPVGGPCSDGDSCTIGDQCQEGKCKPGAPPTCDDGNSCTKDSCGPLGCTYEPLTGGPCDDGNQCTPISSCKVGVCQGSGTLTCSDDNLCTTDYCDPALGCVHLFNAVPCSDGNICTLQDQCHLGSCLGSQPLPCSDSNPCTDDSCNPLSGCQFLPNQKSCDDGLLCTLDDQCQGGLCLGTSLLPCDDSNSCTDDYCDLVLGCVHFDNDSPCSDNDACTKDDICSAGKCSGLAVDCSDSNVCTDDGCDPQTGCLHKANAEGCNDGNACTQNDICAASTCGGQLIACNDNEACTDDTCNPATGCLFTTIPNCCGNGLKEAGEDCDDGNHQSGDGCSDLCKSEKFVFQASQTIDGMTVTCSGTTNNASYTQCDDLKAAGLYFPNGITCGPSWSSTNSSYSNTVGFCQSLTGSGTIQVYYVCNNSQPRATWYNHVWGTFNDNGYTQHVRCYYP